MRPHFTKRTRFRPNAKRKAFTLVELIVGIAVLALLAALSLPALGKTNIKSHGLQCRSNVKQLTAAWTSWSLDHSDKLLGSRDWIAGDASDPAGRDFIDLDKRLPASPLNTYLSGKVKVYKCPSDSRVSIHPLYRGTPVARSVSMNNWIGVEWDPGFFIFRKTSDLNRPGPSSTFVIADENQNSINDGVFIVPMGTYDPNNLPGKEWVDLPAAYHSKAGSLSFADGHAETHKWTDSRTPTAPIFAVSPFNLDLDWLQSKSSAKISNPTR